MIAWHPVIRPFKNSRVLIIVILFFHYNNCLLFYIQKNKPAQTVSARSEKPKGMGSIPRSPHSFNIIFPCMFMCAGFSCDHHTPSSFNHQISSMPDPTHITWRSTIHLSQASAWDHGKSTWTKEFWAQNYNWHPLLLKATRPIFFIFLFSFTYLFCLNYFLTQN